MQKHTLDKQVQAYVELQELYGRLEPSDFVNDIFSSALQEWEDDYDMQLYKINNQFEAASNFFNFKQDGLPDSVLEQIRLKAFQEWPGDYEMQLYTLKNQVEAWCALNG